MMNDMIKNNKENLYNETTKEYNDFELHTEADYEAMMEAYND